MRARSGASPAVPLVAGIDSSTQACTIVLRELAGGRIVDLAEAPHPPASPPSSEQRPEAWWQALLDASDQLDLSNVAAVSVDGQGHGLVALDATGRSVRPAKLWNDTTAAAEARALVDRLGAERWSRRTGIVPVSAITVAKLLWLKRHEPDAFAATRTLLVPPDYLTYRLTGRFVTDRSAASGTGYLGVGDSSWAVDVLELVDAGRDWTSMLPHVAGPIEAAGRVTPEAAEQTGFPEGTVVGPGANDQPVSALAMGIVGDDIIVSLGTSGTVSVRTTAPLVDPTGAVTCVADAAGAYRPLVCTLNATRVTDAVARVLGVDLDGLAQLALASPPDPSRPLLLPYLDGERTPDRPSARGVLVGLDAELTREQVARAAFEGVICGLLEGLDALRAAGGAAGGRLVLTGGGAASVAYRQLLADLADAPVYVSPMEETSAAGAAVQAAAVYERQPIETIARRWAPPLHEVARPRPSQAAAGLRGRYRRLVDLKGLDAL